MKASERVVTLGLSKTFRFFFVFGSVFDSSALLAGSTSDSSHSSSLSSSLSGVFGDAGGRLHESPKFLSQSDDNGYRAKCGNSTTQAAPHEKQERSSALGEHGAQAGELVDLVAELG